MDDAATPMKARLALRPAGRGRLGGVLPDTSGHGDAVSAGLVGGSAARARAMVWLDWL